MWIILEILAGLVVGFISGYLGKKFARWMDERMKKPPKWLVEEEKL